MKMMMILTMMKMMPKLMNNDNDCDYLSSHLTESLWISLFSPVAAKCVFLLFLQENGQTHTSHLHSQIHCIHLSLSLSLSPSLTLSQSFSLSLVIFFQLSLHLSPASTLSHSPHPFPCLLRDRGLSEEEKKRVIKMCSSIVQAGLCCLSPRSQGVI